MSYKEFPDNSEALFGRGPDLAYLSNRCERSGITVVSGRPQMGKTTLLLELSRQMSQKVRATAPTGAILNLSAPTSYLVGYAEAGAENPDQMLRVVADLYSRWLSDARYREQAKLLYGQYKEDLVGRTGEAVGVIFKELSKLGSKPVEVVGSLVKETFDALASANRDLKSGGIQLPRLQVDQSHDLLSLLQSITQSKLILVFDQWEKSPNLQLESNILDAFLRHLADWPSCHMIVGVRPDDAPRKILMQLQKGFEVAMDIFDLPPLHLEGDSGPLLLKHVRGKIKAASEATDAELLKMIAGYPGVLAKWVAPYNRDRVTSIAQLKETALEAQNYRYDEFATLLPALSEEARSVTMRISLMPACSTDDGWEALRPLVMKEAKSSVLDTLKNKGILESGVPPSFGHATRLEAVRRWLNGNHTFEFKEICEELIFDLGSEIGDISPRDLPFATSLAEMEILLARPEISTANRAVCISALTLLGVVDFDSKSLRGMTRHIDKSRASVAPLLATGIFNSLNAASQVGAMKQRDEMLEELRALSRHFPELPAVRDWFVRGLYNTIVDYEELGKSETKIETILSELRTLTQSFPDESNLRLWLTKAVLNELIRATGENASVRRNAMLTELRWLAERSPSDEAVRGNLAQGLLNALTYAKQERNLDRLEALLEQLRGLHKNYPEDLEVREQLAMGLFNALNSDAQVRLRDEKTALLNELRLLARTFPHDSAVRLRFAKALLTILTLAKGSCTPKLRDSLLEELRGLTNAFPDDEVIRPVFAIALFNVLNDYAMVGQFELSDSSLSQLRELARLYPRDAGVRAIFVKGLTNMISYYEGDAKSEALIREFESIVAEYPGAFPLASGLT